MAEPKNTQYPIPLQGQLLNTSSYEYDTKQFVGFNKLEGSFYQGTLSPFYSKDKTIGGNFLFIDDDNNEWYSKNNVIYKNGVEEATFNNTYTFLTGEFNTEDDIIGGIIDSYPFYITYDSQNYKLCAYHTSTKVIEFSLSSQLSSTEVHFANDNEYLYAVIGESEVVVAITLDPRSPTGKVIFYNSSSSNSISNKFISVIGNYVIIPNGTNFYCFSKDTSTTLTKETLDASNTATFSDGTILGKNINSYLGICNDILYFRNQPPRFEKKLGETYTSIDLPIYWSGLSISVASGATSTISASNKKCLTLDTIPTINGSPAPARTTIYADLKINNYIKVENAFLENVSASFSMLIYAQSSSEYKSGDPISVIGRNYVFDQSGSCYVYLVGEDDSLGYSTLTYKGIRIEAVNNSIYNISVCKDIYSQGVIIENNNIINTQMPIWIGSSSYDCSYFAGNTLKYVSENSSISFKQFLGRYIVSNNFYPFNCYDTKTEEFILMGTDVGGALCQDYDTNSPAQLKSSEITNNAYTSSTTLSLLNASESIEEILPIPTGVHMGTTQYFAAISVNEQYPTTGIGICSSIFNAMPVYTPYGNSVQNTMLGTDIGTSVKFNSNMYANLYLTNNEDLSATPSYYCSFSYYKRYNNTLNGLTYPNDTNGNVMLNISPTTEEIESSYLLYTTFEVGNDTYAQLATVDGINLLNYYLGSALYDTPVVFSIAGQVYSIKGKTIYQSYVQNGVVYTTQPILNIGKMKFVGSLPLAAIFYSDANKRLYMFTGDTNLTEFIDITRYGNPNYIKANTTSQDIILVYDDKSLVINDNGLYEIPFTGTKLFFTDNSMLFYNNVKKLIQYVSYYKADDDYTVVPLKVSTCFYGLQNNIVSTNDCVYLRLYNPNDEDGYLNIKATTLMNGIKQTDIKTQTIKSSDFDSESKTYYARFQPALQDATSESFEIETLFSIGALIVSNKPDTALVGTVGNGGQRSSHNF